MRAPSPPGSPRTPGGGRHYYDDGRPVTSAPRPPTPTPDTRTTAQKIYDGASKTSDYARYAGYAGTAAMHVPEPHTAGAGATVAGCSKVVQGVCVAVQGGARLAGATSGDGAYGVMGDVGGNAGNVHDVASAMGGTAVAGYAGGVQDAMAAGRLGMQAWNRFRGNQQTGGRADAYDDGSQVGGDMYSAMFPSTGGLM